MIKKICLFCKKEFFVYPYRADTAKFCSKACGSTVNKNAWKNGRNLMKNGYVRIRINKKYVYEHRHIMEQSLNRPLKPNEVVHHIDGNRTNNNIENLKLFIKTKHDSMETLKRWKENPMGLFGKDGKEYCNAPRIGRRGKGKFCKRLKPCPSHE